MTGLLIKGMVCPTVVILAAFIFPFVNYESLWQPILVGSILAIGAHLLEVILLKNETFIISTVIDFAAAATIIYLVSSYFANAQVTYFGALLTAGLLTLTEIPQHSYLIKSGKTRRSPA